MVRPGRVARWAGALLVGMAAVGALALIGLATSPGNELLRRGGLLIFGRRFPHASLVVDSLQTHIIDGFSLQGVQLRDENGAVLLSLRRVVLKWDLRGARRGRLVVRELRIDEPVVDLRADAQGGLMLSRALRSGTKGTASTAPWGGLPFEVILHKLVLSGGSLCWTGGRLDKLGLRLAGRARGTTIELRSLSGSASVAAPVVADVAFSGGISLRQSDLSLDDLLLKAGHAVLGVSGRVAEVGVDPMLDLSVNLEVPGRAQIDSAFLAAAPATGMLADAWVRGRLDDLGAHLEVDGMAGGELQAGLRADISAPDPAWELSAVTKDLDLGALYPDIFTAPMNARNVVFTATGSGLQWPELTTAYVSLAAEDTVIWGQEVSSLHATGSLAEGRLKIHDLWLSHPAMDLYAEGLLDLPRSKLELQARAELSRADALSKLAGRLLSGAATWRPRVSLDWSQGATLSAEGPVSLRDLSVQGVSVGRGEGSLNLRSDEAGLAVDADLVAHAIVEGGVQVDKADLGVRVRVNSEAGSTVGTEIDASGLQLEGASLRVASVRGRVDVVAPAQGETAVSAALQLDDVFPTGRREDGRGRGTLTLDLRENQLDAKVDIQREGGGSMLSARVSGDLAQTSTWAVDGLVLEPLAGLRFVGEGSQEVRLDDTGLADLDVHLSGEQGALFLTRDEETGRFHIQGQELKLGELEGLAALLPGEPGKDAPSGVMPRISGVGDIDLWLGLSPDDEPYELGGEVSITALSVPELATDLDLRLSVDGELSSPTLSLDVLPSGRDQPLLRARGVVPFDVRGRTLACGKAADLSLVLPPADQALFAEHLSSVPSGKARLSAAVDVSGDICDPVLHMVAAADLPAGQQGELVRADVQVDRNGDQLTLAGFFDEGFRRRLSVRGTARTGMRDAIAAILSPSGPGGSRLDAPDVDLRDPSLWASQLQLSVVPLDLSIEDLATFIDLPPGLSGGISGGFQLAGDPRTPVLSGALQLINGQLGAVSVQSGLLVLMPAEGGYELSLDLGMVEDETLSHDLHVAGFVPVAVGGKTPSTDSDAGMDLHVNGALPMGLLDGVVRGVTDPAGALMLDARLTGSPRAPVVRAKLSLADGALSYEPLGLVYDDLNLELRVDGEQLFIDRLEMSNHKRYGLLGGRSGRSGRNGRRPRTLSGTAHAVLDGWAPASVDATVDLDGFWLVADQDHELALSGDLTMSGAWPSPLVSGSLAVDTSQMIFGEDAFAGDRSLSVDHSLTITRSKASSVARPHKDHGPAPWRRFSMDIDLDLLRNLRLRATVPLQSDYGQQFAQLSSVGLDAELGGELRLTQQNQKLALQGSIETLRGTATVLGVPFDIGDGTISFLGDGVDNPLVDVDAVRHTGSYGDVNVKLSGFVDSLKIEPSSEDYPDKTDVVTLLLFGKPASEMGDTEGAAGAQVVAATLSALTGSVEQALGASVFDELEIDPSAVRVGWALSDRLFLRLQRRFEDNGTDNQTEVTLEYLISRRLYAEFTTGDRAVSSASLYWRWRF